MAFPKYIEFADGSLVIFSGILNHNEVARAAGKEAVSAGMASFPSARDNRYKFFGQSVSLNLNASKELSPVSPTWHGGLLKDAHWNELLFSTDASVARALCENAAPLELVGLQDEYGNIGFLPSVTGVSDQEMARFGGTLACDAFDEPVRRAA